MEKLLPIAGTLRTYSRQTLRDDAFAGLTVGVMLIPQGMAYALIAGLPPIYGLYAATVPLLIYAALGTSRQLAVGPVAMVSLLVASGVSVLAEPGSPDYIALAILLALLVGLVQFLLGLFRFGFLVNFLSHPVLSGFTSAAAIIIGASQLKHLLGIEIGRSHLVHEIVIDAIRNAAAISLPTLAVGLVSIVLLVVLRRVKKTFPAALVVVVVATLASWLLNLAASGVSIVGEVPAGLPPFAVPQLSIDSVRALIPAALAISLVGFMESIAVAKTFANMNRYVIDANQELVALGLANVAGAFFQSFPTTGGFSRTAVNAQAGAKTTVASAVSAGIIILTLALLTPLFRYLPNAVLAAIVIVAVAGLINVAELRFLWKVKKSDFILLLVTFAATLLLGIEEGILVGVIASIGMVIHQSSRPHTALMGRIPGTETFRNIERYSDAAALGDTAVFRVDASLYFANIGFVKDHIMRLASDYRVVVLDFYPVNRIDATAVHALSQIAETLAEHGVSLRFAGAKGPVMDVLRRAGVVDQIGEQNFFLEVRHAVSPERGEAPAVVENEPAESEVGA